MHRSSKRTKLMAVGQTKPWAILGSMATTMQGTLELERLSTRVRAANVLTSDSNRNVLFDQNVQFNSEHVLFKNIYFSSFQKTVF